MVEHKVKDAFLKDAGLKKINWARKHMPVLEGIKADFEKRKPLKGQRIACCLHVTKETAVLMETLKAGGAQVALCQSNPLSTQDDVAASLVAEGISVFAWRGVDKEGYYWSLNKVLDIKPTITIDDGADLITEIHTKRTALVKGVLGGQEETTTGVIRLRALAKDGKLLYPVIAVNDTPTKHLFDNYYGTSQSTIDGILRATNVLIAGTTFVIAGYGDCGKGLAERAKGMGASVVVVEPRPVEALRAHLNGFRVMPMREAAKLADIIVTVTGNKHVIREEHFKNLKDGTIIANSGHFNVEIDVAALEKTSKSKSEIRDNVVEYELKDGRKVFVLAEGRLVNLSAAEGHPSEVMDLSFSNQALCSAYLAEHSKLLEKKVYDVPHEIDERIARLKLKSLGVETEKLTPEQEKYLQSWLEGT
ncbi:MAG: adenosylhomocysteinase [Candidatus Norongarragalinales archaeon]